MVQFKLEDHGILGKSYLDHIRTFAITLAANVVNRLIIEMEKI